MLCSSTKQHNDVNLVCTNQMHMESTSGQPLFEGGVNRRLLPTGNWDHTKEDNDEDEEVLLHRAERHCKERDDVLQASWRKAFPKLAASERAVAGSRFTSHL